MYVDSSSLTVPSYGGKKTITVFCDGSWYVKTNTASWGKLTTNENKIVIAFDENKTNQNRTDYFEIASGTRCRRIEIKQLGKTTSTATYLSTLPSTLTFNENGGIKSIDVYCDANWNVASCSYSWIYCNKVESGLNVAISPNPSYEERNGTISLSSGSKHCNINITQLGKSAPISVDHSDLNFKKRGGTNRIRVSCPSQWYISVQPASWVSVKKEGNELVVSVNKNDYTSNRTDWFSIASGSNTIRINVSQQGYSRSVLDYDEFSSHFIDLVCAYDLETDNWLAGLSYSHIKKKFGFRISAMRSFPVNSFSDAFTFDDNEWLFAIDPVFRLTKDNSNGDFQLYAGIVFSNAFTIKDNIGWNAGIRLGWSKNQRVSLYDFSCGLVYFNNEKFFPTMGLGIGIPALPAIGLGKALFGRWGREKQENFPKLFLDIPLAIDNNHLFGGLVFDYVPTHIGWHSAIYYNSDYELLAGLVVRLTNDYNAVDFQLYGGCGYTWVENCVMYDLGMRFAFEHYKRFSRYDFTIGLQLYENHIIPTFGIGFGIPFKIIGISL